VRADLPARDIQYDYASDRARVAAPEGGCACRVIAGQKSTPPTSTSPAKKPAACCSSQCSSRPGEQTIAAGPATSNSKRESET
jgi:hypothetical protein